ncbi:Co2+/Mg2+ efflux protein ApaG [Paraneptunicella aestuarii]|uniref:Co2+/Mg2+ efflux protein ApaG n=1 Tax=Paraneptunicella aestuarii TaxID=2831148 RepID=UPI001E39EE94|nr:Co2+/Mg2+ efflux protein ApaG [Paraneptunicella aestuarii]UAA38182.1 Co2+/Mg2+ efflux protein ApaG [Paraneptunicella aestuarii]
MNQEIADQVLIQVKTRYLAEHPAAKADKYAFAYDIDIHNQGSDTVQLINRYWLITNANGEKTEVHGSGVVGEQPILKPGGSFQYTSGAVLETPVGTMEGYYEMKLDNGHLFKVPIPIFRLAVPNSIN